MRNEKRTLFPSGQRELDLDQPWVRRASSPLFIPNHLSFKGMFMFAHFSPFNCAEKDGTHENPAV